MHSTKFRFTMHLCYRHKSEYLVCSALTSSSIIILLSSLMEQITGTLTQDTNFNLLYLPCSKICTLSFPLTYVVFTFPGELNFNVYAILCSCVTEITFFLDSRDSIAFKIYLNHSNQASPHFAHVELGLSCSIVKYIAEIRGN